MFFVVKTYYFFANLRLLNNAHKVATQLFQRTKVCMKRKVGQSETDS